MTTTIGTLHPAVAAADYAIAALGEDARLLLVATRADWMTPNEARQLEPFAAGLAYLLGVEAPTHRGSEIRTRVEKQPREVDRAIAERLSDR